LIVMCSITIKTEKDNLMLECAEKIIKNKVRLLNLAKEPTVETLVELAKHPRVVAIGETGLDYYHNTEHLELMCDRFRRHIQEAFQLNKPIIVHSRNAQINTIRILQEEKADRVRGVMNCFTESIEMAEQAMVLTFI
jgi:TatD DNase family protein